MHDCGKPYCLEIDDQGKRHFPNHASVSEKTYLDLFDNFSPNQMAEKFPDELIVADLIANDMLFHTQNYEHIKSLNLPVQTIATLIITAFAELHSNAAMFGGIESISFKIKYKKLCKSAKQFVLDMNSYVDAHSYVFVRQDLPYAQKVVQSAHAAYEASRTSNTNKHPSLVCVVVKSEMKLKQVMGELIENDIQFKIFRDNIFNHEITGLCTEPLTDKRHLLKRFMLLAEPETVQPSKQARAEPAFA